MEPIIAENNKFSIPSKEDIIECIKKTQPHPNPIPFTVLIQELINNYGESDDQNNLGINSNYLDDILITLLTEYGMNIFYFIVNSDSNKFILEYNPLHGEAYIKTNDP